MQLGDTNTQKDTDSAHHAMTLHVTACKGNYAMKRQISYIFRRSKWICQETSVASILEECNEQKALIQKF